jgi:uncharacterized protein with HEPN domain
MKNKPDLTYVGDVLDAIKRIEGYLRGVDKDTFEDNLMMQDAVMHQIEIIGEASNRISDEFQEKHPELPWIQMRAIRNKIVHDYREVNLEVIWDTAKNDLPPLKKQIKRLLED